MLLLTGQGGVQALLDRAARDQPKLSQGKLREFSADDMYKDWNFLTHPGGNNPKVGKS